MTYTHQDPIAIIGCGNVGGAIAIALSRAGYHVVSAASRTFSSAVKLVEFSGAQKAYESIQDAVELAEVIFIKLRMILLKRQLNLLRGDRAKL